MDGDFSKVTMVSGKFKSRTKRRVKKRTPSGKVKTVYLKRKPQPAKCANCKAILKGVPRKTPSKLKSIPKTQRRPERPYGGNLCSKCMRAKIISKTRKSEISP